MTKDFSISRNYILDAILRQAQNDKIRKTLSVEHQTFKKTYVSIVVRKVWDAILRQAQNDSEMVSSD